MYHLHLARAFRTLTFCLVTAMVLGIAATLWWANRTGLPETWRNAIEREVAKQGIYVKIGSLSYHPLRGIVAGKLRVYSSPTFEREVSNFERVILDFDNAKLAKGEIHLSKLELNDATLTLPLTPSDPRSEILEIQHASGILLMPGGNVIDIRNASGLIAGIRVTINAHLTNDGDSGKTGNEPQQADKRKAIVGDIISELNKWSFDPQNPPHLRILIEGNPQQAENTRARLSLTARGMEKNQHRVEEVFADAELSDHVLTVNSLTARDARGKLDGRIDFDLTNQHGRFDLQSSLEIMPLLHSWLGIASIRDILVAGKQKIRAEGEFTLKPNEAPQVRMTGHALCESAMLRGIRFDSVESDFAWRNGDLFLRGVSLTRADGRANGKIMIQGPLVRMSLNSTLPPSTYLPLFPGKPLEKVIHQFGERKDSKLELKLEGGFDTNDPLSWAFTGSGDVRNVDYGGVPIDHAACGFSLSQEKLDFYDGTVTFNYTHYPLRVQHGGTTTGTAHVGQILYSLTDRLLSVKDVGGTVWAAPLVRLFSPSIANSIEAYRFRNPPALTGNGTVDFGQKERTHLVIDFSSKDIADYKLLGADVALEKPSGKVLIDNQRVTIENLQVNAFGGPVSARLSFPGDATFTSEIQWTKVAMDEINKSFQLGLECGGEFTGRINFGMNIGELSTMKGEGLCGIEKTELFSVPMFGPLSRLISGVLRDKRTGFERAKSAFCTFRIQDGTLFTDDFNALTTSLVFAGDGSVNLDKRTMDMTMRLNARGILGLITLPFRPFYGLFQFRGTGPLHATQWENVLFTTPNEKQEKILLNPPKATVIPNLD